MWAVVVTPLQYVGEVNEISDETLQETLNAVCSTAAGHNFQSIGTIAGDLWKRAEGPDDPLFVLANALGYDLGEVVERTNRTDTAIFELWSRAMDSAPVAIVRARFADLLWEAHYGDHSHKYARRAIDEYVKASGEDFGEPIESSDGLLRALGLATSINDIDLRQQVVRASVELVSRELNGEKRRPGVVLQLLAALADQEQDCRPAELDELIGRAIDQYGDDPWNLESTLEIRARLTDPAKREALWRTTTEAFADMARRTTGIAKYAYFQRAIEHAEQHGLHQVAEELRREVEGLPKDALDLQIISGEVQIPREKIDQYIAYVVGDDNIESALARFGSHTPTGLPEENREFIQQLMTEYPLQYIFPRMVIGPENSLIRVIRGANEQEEQALLDHESLRTSMFSIFAIEILEGIRDRYGPISSTSAWFQSDLIEPAVGERIGKAIELYESGDPDAAASLITPRLERIVRRVAGLVGLTVTSSPDRSGRPGGVKGLGQLLSLLEGHLPEPTRRYLRVALSEVTGLNLRNRISHGLVDLVTQHEAALLIHVVCHLRLFQPQNPGNSAV